MASPGIFALPLTLEQVRKQLGEPTSASGVHTFSTPNGEIHAGTLEGGVTIQLGLDFDTEPTQAGAILRLALGAALDGLVEPRAFVYPEVARPAATSYEALVVEVGEGGEWVPVPSEAEANARLGLGGPAGAPGGDLFGALQSMMGGDMLGKMQASFQGMTGGQGLPGGADLPGGIEGLAGLAQQLLGDPAMRDALQQAGEQLLRSGALPEIDPEKDLFTQAQDIASRMMAGNPQLAGLGALLGAAADEGDADEEIDGESEDER